MPFIMMCGLPCSGKTTRSNELKSCFENVHHVSSKLITEHRPDVQKNLVYSDSTREKELRSTLKSEVQRIINKDDVLILDAPNYIKGYRYELYCVSKSAQTPQCIIYCATTAELASRWNEGRQEKERYTQEVFDGLVMRFEAPEDRNRWDSPLFIVTPGDELPYDQIHDALFHRKAPPPNLSTLSQPLSATNFLHELDAVTQSVIATIVEHAKTGVPGDLITIPGASDKLTLSRLVPLPELQRLRRQFIGYTKTLSLDDSSKITNLFVQFLNSRI